MVWLTVWDIAKKRHGTNLGEDTLSEHSVQVLQAFVAHEQATAMRNALGGVYYVESDG